MGAKMARLIESLFPGGLDEHDPEWHLDKIIEFTRFKALVNEPSPHLRIMGYFCEGQSPKETAWRLACYAATYCLPSGQVIWDRWPYETALTAANDGRLREWVAQHWPGIVTRTERRCVRSINKMSECLTSAANWINTEFEPLVSDESPTSEYYDRVWDSVLRIKFFGRYIAIRYIEGLRRYCGVPAQLYDMRSIGGWSPKKALVYFYPQHMDDLLTEGAKGNRIAEILFNTLMEQFYDSGQPVDHYVLAAMLCEYREAFEDHHQYPGWTIDQEPLLFNKVAHYWGDAVAINDLWVARAQLFPQDALGEVHGWEGTRWSLTKTLRDNGYNWTDTEYDYLATLSENSFDNPIRRIS